MSGMDISVVVARLGGELLPDKGDGWINRFEIKSESSDRLYTVSQNTKQGHRWECSCPAWRTRRKCKHLETMMPTLRLVGEKAAPEARETPALPAPGRSR